MSSLDRQAPCPNCGAALTFSFGGARAIVCSYCRFVVARTDRGLQASGRMADLIELPTPFQLGRIGSWGGEPFVVEGRIQMDRAEQASAPWEEVLLAFPNRSSHTWVAYAQGRWYATTETAFAAEQLPPLSSLRPGSTVDLGQHGAWVVQELGQRVMLSGEGCLTMVPAPGVHAGYADISAQGGRFGTIDYGAPGAAPTLYLGKQFDPAELRFEDGAPLQAPQAKVSKLECPTCGGDLPLLSQASERVVCQYCGTASDIRQGTLSALGPAPKPPVSPQIPIGTRGELGGQAFVVAGFVIRSCVVEGIRYSWREYLLFGGERVGYRWLMEEDGSWSFVLPIEAGEVLDSGSQAQYRGQAYSLDQSVRAQVDFVLGEFYWKVEIGETVDATEWRGHGGKVSRERSPREVTYSFVSPIAIEQLASFGIRAPVRAQRSSGQSSNRFWVLLVALGIPALAVMCCGMFVFIGAANTHDFEDVLDGDVKLAATEQSALKKLFEQNSIPLKSVNVDNLNDSSCDYCKGLVVENGHVTLLRFEQRGLKTLAGVEALTKLKVLRVPGNRLSEVAGLSALGELKSADLSGNQLQSVGDLSGCDKLTKLDLRNNKLASLKGIAGMALLADLQLLGNPINSVEGLSDLPALKALTLDDAKLTSFKGLGSLPALVTLRVSKAQLTSLQGLDKLSALDDLTVNDNKLTSLATLAVLPKLKRLDVRNNKLTSLGDLPAQPMLERIDAGHNLITSLDGIEVHPKLVSVNVDHNRLTQLGGKGHDNLRNLSARNNKLENVEEVAPMAQLRTVDVSGNKLSHLGKLITLASLTKLAASNNRITSLNGIGGMRALSEVDVSHNHLTNLDPLTGLPQLSNVNARHNRIDKLGAAGFLAKPPRNYDLTGNAALVGLIILAGSYKPVPKPTPRPYGGTRSPQSRYRSGGGPSLGK